MDRSASKQGSPAEIQLIPRIQAIYNEGKNDKEKIALNGKPEAYQKLAEFMTGDKKKLVTTLLKEKDIQEQYGKDLEPLNLRLDRLTSALQQKVEVKQEAKKEGIMKMALRKLKESAIWAKDHPIKAALLAAVLATAVAGGTIVVGSYMAGGVEAFFAKVGLSHLYEAAKAAMSGGKLVHGVWEGTYGGSTGAAKILPMEG